MILPVWPLVCSANKCHNATYPHASTLVGAYLAASSNRWTVVIHGGDDESDYLLCPLCSYNPPAPRRMEI